MPEERQFKITFRKASIAEASAVAEVHVRSWRESFVGIVPQTNLNKMSVEHRTEAVKNGFAQDAYRMFLAETPANEIVGFADFGQARNRHSKFEAELYAIYLLRDFQRNGIAGKLLTWRCSLLLPVR